MKRMNFKILGSMALLSTVLSVCVYAERDLDKLSYPNSNNFPKTVLFRTSERALANGVAYVDTTNLLLKGSNGRNIEKKVSIKQFIQDMEPYSIFIGKAVEEERTGVSRVITGLTKLKEAAPEKTVLLHFNGRCRRPEFQVGDEPFFPGHWVYQTPDQCLNAIQATNKKTVIKVADVTPYLKANGKVNTRLVFCLYAVVDGKRDFYHSEYVSAVDADVGANTITVSRGDHKSTPRSYAAGQAELACLLTIHGRFTYNFSTVCPLDNQGRNCIEALTADLVELFSPQGKLHAFDGILFDAMSVSASNKKMDGNVDLDMDGTADLKSFVGGIFDPWIGFTEYSRLLRETFGEDFLLLGDSRTPGHHRSFSHFNGTESESWPDPDESHEFRKWSSGIARHQFLDGHLRKPSLHHFNPRPDSKSEERLNQVAAACVNAGHVTKYRYLQGEDELAGYTDEMSKGHEFELGGWMGQPLGEMVRLAERAPRRIIDLPAEKRRFTPSQRLSTNEDGGIAGLPTSVLRIAGITVPGSEIYFKLRLRADSFKQYPDSLPRTCWIRAIPVGNQGQAIDSNKQKAGSRIPDAHLQYVYVDPDGETYGVYFNRLSKGEIDLEFVIEGHEAAELESIEAYDAADVIYREFEHGVVIGNPSPQQVVLNMQELFPGQTFRRIKGRVAPAFNDGSAVSKKLTLDAFDGIFLVKEGSRD